MTEHKEEALAIVAKEIEKAKREALEEKECQKDLP